MEVFGLFQFLKKKNEMSKKNYEVIFFQNLTKEVLNDIKKIRKKMNKNKKKKKESFP